MAPSSSKENAATRKTPAKKTAGDGSQSLEKQPVAKKAPAKAKTAAKPKSKSAPAATSKPAAPKPAAKPAATKPAAAKTSATSTAKAAPKAASKAAPKSADLKTTKAPTKAKVPAKTPVKTAAKTAAAPKSAAAPKAVAKPKPPAKPKTPAKPKPSTHPEKPWLKNYPTGIAAEIEPFTHTSLADFMLDSCRRYATRPAFICMGNTLTFAEVEEKSRYLAAYFLSLGLKKGDRVALMMPNIHQYPIALMAILRAGLVAVNVNPLYTVRELAHQLKNSGAQAIVVLENFASTVQAAHPETDLKHVIVATMGDMLGLKGLAVNFVLRHVKHMVPAWKIAEYIPFKRALRKGAAIPFKPQDITLDDPAFLQYTGGTTGIAKGAILLHRNVLANTMQNTQWLETAYIDQPKPDHLTMVCALPLYHIYALTVNALMGMKLGATNLLIVNPRDIPSLIKELSNNNFNIIVGLNTLFNAMLHNSMFKKLDFSHLNLTLGGGMAVQRTVADRWMEVTGKTIHEGYGLSETSPVVAANRFCDTEFTGTIGLPLPSTDVVICDDDGKPVALGTVGELCVRGPQVMTGYWQQPRETANSFTPDGLFKTGDMGVMDENGYISIVDRKKDMILVSGFNVYPNEIEEVISSHPGVLEAAVIGVPNEHSGEVPKAFIVRKDPSLTALDIKNYCRDRLTGYKLPRLIEFRDSLPKSNVGKFLRRELK